MIWFIRADIPHHYLASQTAIPNLFRHFCPHSKGKKIDLYPSLSVACVSTGWCAPGRRRTSRPAAKDFLKHAPSPLLSCRPPPSPRSQPSPPLPQLPPPWDPNPPPFLPPPSPGPPPLPLPSRGSHSSAPIPQKPSPPPTSPGPQPPFPSPPPRDPSPIIVDLMMDPMSSDWNPPPGDRCERPCLRRGPCPLQVRLQRPLPAPPSQGCCFIGAQYCEQYFVCVPIFGSPGLPHGGGIPPTLGWVPAGREYPPWLEKNLNCDPPFIESHPGEVTPPPPLGHLESPFVLAAPHNVILPKLISLFLVFCSCEVANAQFSGGGSPPLRRLQNPSTPMDSFTNQWFSCPLNCHPVMGRLFTRGRRFLFNESFWVFRTKSEIIVALF